MGYSCPYTLPQAEFVGGSTQDFAFRCYHHGKTGRPMDMSGADVCFSIIDYANRHGDPIVHKTMEARMGDGTYNVLFVTIPPEDTVNLCGKYIYQITIQDGDGTVEIPNQGLLYITNNIHKKFASHSGSF